MTENNAAQPGLNDTIRAVFLEHGFTIKHGQTDLKPYVYEAVHALLSKLRAEGVQAGDERAIDAAALLGKYKKLCIEIGRGDSYHLRRIDAAIAALANTPSAVPENWKLVPIKPTPKMMEAWYDAFNANIKSAARSTLAYRALIDAAPDALASAPVAEPYDSEQRCRAYYDSDLRPFAADGLTYNVWQAVWHAAQFDRAMYPNSSKPRPHSAPAAGEAQGVSVERLAKDPFLAAQLWRNPVDRAPIAGEAVAWRALDGHGLPQTEWIDGDPGPDMKSAWVGGHIERAHAATQADRVAGEAREPVGEVFRHGEGRDENGPRVGIRMLPAAAGLPHGTQVYAAPQASECECARRSKAIADSEAKL
ncbi:hypothetical protein ELS24_10095 [Achromobacter spanius]|uniref:hypothetical protein n=1 Tax=Achromobacter spanius TaxID=217203 RepID=UPI000F8F9944|nr:hypothetical protein [Achromobacter spanius]AZS78762.1 hypothetical protein ELS24_10095 [Achromobacter spanius]